MRLMSLSSVLLHDNKKNIYLYTFHDFLLENEVRIAYVPKRCRWCRVKLLRTRARIYYKEC